MIISSLRLKIIVIATACIVSISTHAQNFTWIKGTNLLDQAGLYGSLGVSNATNNPGSREGAVHWKDAAGNFWLFGGYGYDNSGTLDLLSDLWKYSPATNQWTWVKGDSVVNQSGVYGTLGVGANANKPGARVSTASWADNSGNLWLFGGSGYDGNSNNGYLNDLWKYNIANNQWTWVKGPNNVDQNGSYGVMGTGSSTTTPGSRIGSVSWIDAAGQLWLFAGLGYDASSTNWSYLNDVWKFNITSNQWTWVKGSNIVDQNGIYGTINTPSITNTPGSRFGATGGVDASGNVWVFAGDGFDASSSVTGFLNDLWKYDMINNQWTWVSGSNSPNQPGVYGTMGVPATTNIPRGRAAQVSWIDGSGNLWLFGGVQVNSMSFDFMNDLWRYNPATGQWTWMKGSNIVGQTGVYGTKGIPASANVPGARGYFPSGWIDAANNLWLFGGAGHATSSTTGDLNDLWRFSNCTASPLNVSTSPTFICPGKTATLTATGATTYTWSTTQQGNSISVSPANTTTYTVFSTNSTGCPSGGTVAVNVIPPASMTVQSSSNPACTGNTITLSASGATSYTWNYTQPFSSIMVSPLVTTDYTLVGTVTGCTTSLVYTQTIVPTPTVMAVAQKSIICLGETISLIANGASNYTWSTSQTGSNVLVTPSINTTYTVTGADSLGCSSTASVLVKVSSCVSLSERSIQSIFQISPNPNNGEFSILHLGVDLRGQKIFIYNGIGQIVFESVIQDAEMYLKTELSKGIYYYAVEGLDENQFKGKILIE